MDRLPDVSPARDEPVPADLLPHALAAKGFMPEDEGEFLHRTALAHLADGPALEIGSYCGKSAIYLGAAAREVDSTVFTLDHHRGSEENQAGWEHHDPTLVDSELGRMDTLPTFRRTIALAGLEDWVVAVVGRSTTVAAHWRTPVALLFIDGGHAEIHAQNDYTGFAHWVQPGGVLVIHDVFERPEDGGQAPYHVWLRAVESADFVPEETVGSMRVLRRVGAPGQAERASDAPAPRL
jgi:MMP 1-O-methyltransferase